MKQAQAESVSKFCHLALISRAELDQQHATRKRLTGDALFQGTMLA